MMPEQQHPHPHEPTPGLVGVGIQELLDSASRLGLTWNLRIGTVTEVSSSNLIRVRLDGDTESISVVSMIGTTYTSARVYVITIPPAGNFVIGAVSRVYPRSRIATQVRDVNSAAFTTTETVTDTVTASLIEGLTYTVNSFISVRSSAAGDRDLVRVREDTLTGTVLRSANVFVQATGTATDFPLYQEVLYTAIATGDKTFVLTGSRAAGTGSITHTAGTANRAYLYVELVQ